MTMSRPLVLPITKEVLSGCVINPSMDRIENAARSFILRLYKPSLHLPSCFAARSMLPRLSQAARLFSSPSSPTSIARLPSLLTGMALVHQRSSRTVHTAACLIIGDEVLGGKVHVSSLFSSVLQLGMPADAPRDSRCG